MSRFVEGADRSQSVLFPERLDDYIGEDNPVRVVDAFVENLDLVTLGFERAIAEATGRPGFIAEIGSVDQLDDSARKPLYVAGVRLAQTADGQSLPELCEEIASIIRQGTGPVASFMGRLLSAGYSPEMRDQYVRRFRCDEIGYRLVTAESPRLITATVPTAVRWVRYALNLDAIPVVASSFSEIAGDLGVSQTWN